MVLQVMIKHLVIASTDKFNLFPAKYGISEYYSPETLVTRKILDFLKHCQCEFGDYVQAYEYTNPRNNMRTRCIDGMYLRPAGNGTGHYLMDLQTGRDVIRGRKITVIPLTDAVKNVVESMGTKQGFETLKFQKKSSETLLHEDLVPGCDHNALNDYYDVEDEVVEDDAGGEEIFGHDGDAVEEFEEPENNKEQERIINNNDFEGLEGVAKVPEPQDDQAERMINKLIEAFEEDVLPEGEQVLEDINDDKIEESLD